jgi:hypothetical protein
MSHGNAECSQLKFVMVETGAMLRIDNGFLCMVLESEKAF